MTMVMELRGMSTAQIRGDRRPEAAKELLLEARRGSDYYRHSLASFSDADISELASELDVEALPLLDKDTLAPSNAAFKSAPAAVTPSTRPPEVASRPSLNFVPAWNTFAPVASARSLESTIPGSEACSHLGCHPRRWLKRALYDRHRFSERGDRVRKLWFRNFGQFLNARFTKVVRHTCLG